MHCYEAIATLTAAAMDTARAADVFRGHWGGSPDRADRTGYLRGTVPEARAMVEEFRALGCTRLSIALREGPYDWEALEAFAAEIVRPRWRGSRRASATGIPVDSPRCSRYTPAR